MQQGPGRPSIPVKKQDSYYEIGERFSVTPSAAFNSFYSLHGFGKQLQERAPIKWPPGQTLKNTTKTFEDMKGFPGVVGAINRTHIPIKVPIENPNDYINRKFSILFQFQDQIC